MERGLERSHAVWVGAFVLSMIGLAVIGLFVVGAEQGWASDVVNLETAMPNVQGLRVGTRVRVLGISAGQVSAIEPPAAPGNPVVVRFWISAGHAKLVRVDAKVRLYKDSLLGEQVIEIDPGSPDSDTVPNGFRLTSTPSTDWETLFAKANSIVDGLESGQGTLGKLLADEEAYDELRQVVRDWNGLFGKVSSAVDDVTAGNGTVGKLLTDDGVYEEVQSLVNRAQTVLGRVDENLHSAKQNWLLQRWMKDRYQLLVRPDAKTYRQVFKESDLFERDRAILTLRGKRLLAGTAKWIHGFDEKNSEILIAGFAPDEDDARLAELTTKTQAEAVRAYLVDHHEAHKTGWFARRTVSSQGFGNLPDPANTSHSNTRRVEILAFIK